MKKTLVVFSIAALLLTACSAEKHETTGVVPPPSSSSDNQKGQTPQPEMPGNEVQGLMGTTWTMSNPTESAEITVELSFDGYFLSASSTCRTHGSMATVKYSSGVLYSNEGKTAEVMTSLNLNFGDCRAEIPQGMKFELENDQIFTIDNGKRLLSKLKRKL